jgi:hypothetical protein
MGSRVAVRCQQIGREGGMRRQKRGPAELQLLVRTRPIKPITEMTGQGISILISLFDLDLNTTTAITSANLIIASFMLSTINAY